MLIARRISSFVAMLISVVALLTLAEAQAGAGIHPTGAGLDVVEHYSGPYGSEPDCNAAAQAMHDPASGFYAVWPCTWAGYWGPGWYFYYRYYDPYCRRCTIELMVGTLRVE